MTQATIAYADSHTEDHLTELIELVSIPSISTLREHIPDVREAAQWVGDQMVDIGLEDVRIFATQKHPVVFGQWTKAGPDAPTVLVYGHYDVQPADPLDEWRTEPFEPTIQDGNLYARGASDDKGQLFVHLKSVQSYFETAGALPVNMKFMIEGEEEIGSPNLGDFIDDHRERLSADVALVSDSSILAPDQPSIVYGLRGLAYTEVVVTGPDHDLHSGSFGGGVRNPANALAGIIAGLKDSDGRITVPGFYDNVRLDAEERETLAKVPFDEGGFRREVGVEKLWGEATYTTLERITGRPTLDVNGIWGGFTGEGAKTVIPSRAAAKISMRLVPDQDPERVIRIFSEYVEELAPPEVQVEVRTHAGAVPVLVDRDTPAIEAAMTAYERGFGRAPAFTREGGTIPVVGMFAAKLGIPTVLMGFGLPDDRLHSPNEKFNIDNFYKGIHTSIYFLNALAANE
ncbi:MAG: Succinyl-diaminopimelate desuccinylase [Anaerolineales bacterium]|nr:Succinyl-diaminopimelate desuccinylase [Anaerolineales bacterium]